MAKAVETSEKAQIIRAIDLGWGYTKYSKLEPDGSIGFSGFPSLAPRHIGTDLSSSILGRRNTVIVEVDGTQYEVGPDSTDLDSNDSTRNLNEQFIYTDQYKAVFLGALSYIGEPVIDLLVVGLPLSGINQTEKLKELAVGIHKMEGGKLVEVKDVLVLPQPLGGLYYCLSQTESRQEFLFLEDEMNLVIDPGFLTFDFLLARGSKVIENRSGAHPGGVSKILRAIAESVSQKFGIKYDNLSAIDRGLTKRAIKINGKPENLEEHIRNTKSVIEGSVNYMRNIVGDGADIDNIILIGGGAQVFRKTIEEYYPNHTLISMPDPQLVNVRGYQEAGTAYLAKKLKAC